VSETGAARRDGRTTDTRARIQAAALELFIARGFAQTSLREIADQLGVTKAALYYHFSSKAELIRSIVQPLIDDTDRFIAEAAASARGPRELLESFFDLLVPHKPLFMALLRDASAFAYVDIEAASVRWLEQLQELLTGPNATDAQRIRAVAAVGGLSRCVIMTNFPTPVLRAASVDAACDALGLDAEGQSPSSR
jgi:AcrR family transcriptional regulator